VALSVAVWTLALKETKIRPHMTPVISTPEVILQFGTERDWERLILFEYRGGAIALLAIGKGFHC
jgi:hypothetical protein